MEIMEILQEMNNKMDANAHDKQRMNGNMEQALRGDMRTQRGEMQSMGLSLQAGVRGIMAPARGGTTEPRGNVECVRPTMETGEVGTMSDATTIDGETCRTRHDGTTEKLKEVTEMKTETEMQKIKETKEKTAETWEMEQVEEKLQEIDEHTHIELVRDNEVEHEECFVTWC